MSISIKDKDQADGTTIVAQSINTAIPESMEHCGIKLKCHISNVATPVPALFNVICNARVRCQSYWQRSGLCVSKRCSRGVSKYDHACFPTSWFKLNTQLGGSNASHISWANEEEPSSFDLSDHFYNIQLFFRRPRKFQGGENLSNYLYPSNRLIQ